MTITQLTPALDEPQDHEAAIRAFIADQSATLSQEGAERYMKVVDDLFDFLRAVDVRGRLGPEIAAHLDAERARLGVDCFMPTLGVASLVRVLPEFLADPWLPAAGAQRRSHRAVVDKLLTYLRRRSLVDSVGLGIDFRAARQALRTARARDYDRWSLRDDARSGPSSTVTVTLTMSDRLIDSLLDQVEDEHHESLDEALEAYLRPEPEMPSWYWQRDASIDRIRSGWQSYKDLPYSGEYGSSGEH